jgi:hypothetical protein
LIGAVFSGQEAFMKHSIRLLAAAAALALSSVAATGATLTFQGATFTASSVGDVLTIGIDADPLHLTGDWASAVWIDSIEVKNVGSYSSVSMTGTGGAWTYAPAELNASGCSGGNDPAGACFSHSPVALADGMSFAFTYTGGPFDFSAPTLKVRFLNADLEKQGSLLSQPIPEPGTYALMLGGLGLIGFMARRRRLS